MSTNRFQKSNAAHGAVTLGSFDINLDSIRQIKSGDEKQFEKLLKKYSPLINKVKETYSIDGYDSDDIAQVVRLSIWKAVLCFDESRVTDSPGKVLSRLISKITKSEVYQIGRASIAESRTCDELVEYDDDRYAVENDDIAFMETASLFEKTQTVIFNGLLGGYTQREIADSIGKSQRVVHKNIGQMRELVVSAA